VNRRIFLRGLGGACVAAPFLGSIGVRGTSAQTPPAPKRLILMFTHYGCITTRFFPAKSHGPLSADDLAPTTLKYLVPYVDKLLVPRGIRAMNEWTAHLDRGQGGDPHTHIGSFLTCQPLDPNSNDPFGFTDVKAPVPEAVGPSLDHVIAQQLSSGGVPLYIRLGNQSTIATSSISYSGSKTIYPGLGSATQVYSSLTGLFQGGTAMSPDTYQAGRGKSVIDLVRDDLETLERYDMSQSDRNKLEAWKALLDQTGTTMAMAACSAETGTALGATQTNAAAVGTGSLGADVLMTEVNGTGLDGADIFSSLAVLAAVCNANPVIVLKYPANYIFQGLGLTIESGALSHRLQDESVAGSCLPGVIDMLLSIDDYYSQKFAHLVGLLNSIEEADGKLLDNTATVWLQEMSDGAAHNLNNLPIVQVGSAGGYFKTGWAVNVEDGSPNLTTGNSEAFCTDGTPNTIDGTLALTGTDASLANAPINKYYCNLMNALGVKAGADGFPLVGGTAEVTKFGMYDRTEDFVGGGTNPPTIYDPGEFTALKANG
jgi:hypothetical protein